VEIDATFSNSSAYRRTQCLRVSSDKRSRRRAASGDCSQPLLSERYWFWSAPATTALVSDSAARVAQENRAAVAAAGSYSWDEAARLTLALYEQLTE
jgi:hypothetical protein